jgi:Terminase small subunit
MARKKAPPFDPNERGAVSVAVDEPKWQPGLEDLDWKERLFVLLYVREDADALKAYALTYGKPSGWETRAYKMLARASIQSAIVKTQRRLMGDTHFSLDEVLSRLTALADANMRNFVEIDANGRIEFDLRTLADGDWRSIKSLSVKEGRGGKQEIKLELHDAAKALETLGRHHGMGLGTVRVIEEERQERGRLAKMMADLSPDELAQLEAIGDRLQAIAAAPVIDGEAVEVVDDDTSDSNSSDDA